MKLQAYFDGKKDSSPDHVKSVSMAEQMIKERYGFAITSKEDNGTDRIEYLTNRPEWTFILTY